MEKIDYDSLIGTTVGVLDDEGHEYKQIIIKNYKKLGNQIVWVDEDGDIYSDDELNWCYQLTPKGIFAHVMYSYDENISENRIDELWNEFYKSMERNGYVKQ